MNWFDILKVLGTKTGFSQLDFDNIVIEDDDDCKERWQKNVEAYRNFAKRDFKYKSKKEPIGEVPYVDGYVMSKDGTMYSTEYWEPKRKDGRDSSLIMHIIYFYSPDIPEEVYCKALEMWDKNTTGKIDMEGYVITSTGSSAIVPQIIIKNKDASVLAALSYFISMGDWILIDQKDGTMYDSMDKLVEKIKGLKI